MIAPSTTTDATQHQRAVEAVGVAAAVAAGEAWRQGSEELEALPPFLVVRSSHERRLASSDPERPLRRDAERNRARILAAARELFAERGLDVTMDEIARHAGVGVGTVYRRFPERSSSRRCSSSGSASSSRSPRTRAPLRIRGRASSSSSSASSRCRPPTAGSRTS